MYIVKELITFRYRYKNAGHFHLGPSNTVVAALMEEPVSTPFPGTRNIVIKLLMRDKFDAELMEFTNYQNFHLPIVLPCLAP